MAFNAYGGPSEEDDAPGQAAFGNPEADTGGAEVTPQAMAEGGAIPEGDDDMFGDASPNTDVTDYSNAMKIVRQAMNWGRQQHGLPASRPQQANDEREQDTSGIPDDQEEYDDSAGDESYDEGGVIDDEPEMASNDVDYDDETAAQAGAPSDSGEPYQPFAGAIPDSPNAPHMLLRRGANAVMGALSGSAAGAGGDGDDNSGGAPVAEGGFQPSPGGGDNSGAAPVLALQYLQGDGKAADLVKQAEDQVHGDPAQKAQGAVAKIAAEKGEAAGFSAIQYNRSVYNAKAGFAYMALNGTAQKPPDLAAATKAATQATPHLLDGNLLTFAPAEGGVTASAGGETLKLSVPQFNQFLDIRKNGQYDQIFEKGGGLIALKEIMKGPGEPPASMQTGTGTVGRPAGARPQAGAAQRQQDERNAPAGYPMQAQETMERTGPMRSGRVPESGYYDDKGSFRTRTPAHNGSFRQDRPDNTEAPVQVHAGGESRTYIGGVDQTQNENQERKLEQIRAKNEGRPTQSDRLALEDKRSEGRMKIEGEKNKRAEASQAIRDKYNSQRVANELQRIASTAKNADKAVRGRMIDSVIQSSGFSQVPPEIKKMAMDVLNGVGNQQQAAPQQGGGSAPVTVQSPADAAKLAPGTVYMTPDGRKFTR